MREATKAPMTIVEKIKASELLLRFFTSQTFEGETHLVLVREHKLCKFL